MNKVTTIEQFVDKIEDGATIMIGGFLGVGSPLKSIEALVKKGVKDLILMSDVSTYPGGNFDLAPLFANKQVKRFITSHTGTCPELQAVFKAGDVEVDYYPMGTWAEKVRCAGAGLGGVLTPIGLGTFAQEGRQIINVEGQDYILEPPLSADFGIIKGWRADKLGNIEYRGISMNCNPVIATATKNTLAEVNEIVEIGDIDPRMVGTPSIYVQSIALGMTLEEQQKTYTDLWVRTKQFKS
ncbi:CoA transferase subunit A [Fundidesulfovibrio butyratiphilus]